MTEERNLLERHKPRLIVLAQDITLHRPWNRWFERVTAARGDYHPCSAEYFLSFVVQRARPRGFWARLFADPESSPSGIEALKVLAAGSTPEATRDWEIDLAPIKSQRAVQAWRAYDGMLQQRPFRPTMYGRCVTGTEGIGLEYWFLSIYNDAPNRHEGDWEMIAIELDSAEQPVQAGYSSHRSGLRRSWADVEREGDRPLVYVARGSHASYFDHKKGGHRTNSATVPHKGLPPLVEAAMAAGVKALQDLIIFLRLHDKTPTHPDRPGDESLNRGEFLEAELSILSDPASVSADSPLWWMRLRCPWGSSHMRFFGDTAPDPPWVQDQKWSRPVEWIRSLELDQQ